MAARPRRRERFPRTFRKERRRKPRTLRCGFGGVGGRISGCVDRAILLDFFGVGSVESDAPREEHEEGEEGEEDLVFSPLRGQLHEHAHDEAQVGGAGCVCA